MSNTTSAKVGKTQAKQRYLKKKKDRRKAKKSAAAAATAAAKRVKSKSQIPEGDQATESQAEASSEDGDDSEHESGIAIKVDSVKEQKEPCPEPIQVDEETVEQRRHSPTPVAAFPSFPAPVAPDAPSKSELALQGVDKALINAEIIDPKHTLPLETFCTGSSADAQNLPVLSNKMRKRLLDLEIVELFAVQTALLPFLLPSQRRKRSLYCPYDPPQDVCVSAPTGSGKTLAYVVPIVEILSSRVAVNLRALIVLPTRDLVLQVQETFEAIGKGRGLKIGVATGQHSFAHEQTQLVNARDKDMEGGASSVDILICTPGRLIDHLNGTPGFTLQHLRFLVIDEADRLLAQSFQDWLAQVLSCLKPPTKPVSVQASASETKCSFPTSTPTRSALAPLFQPHVKSDYDDPKQSSCQKLLFSATLTRDPARIAALGLRDPKYFVVQGASAEVENEETEGPSLGIEEFTMPAGLKEYYITTSTMQKPLVFFHLIRSREIKNALVFTKSANSTSRLEKLFQYLEEAYCNMKPGSRKSIIQAYSSDLAPSERKTILERFKKQEIDILIASDLVARGLDVPHVEHVISYDVPVDLRKYVHRVGRTARAGREGSAWTLVEEQEARHFKEMLKSVGKARLDGVARVRIRERDLKELEECYETALGELKTFYSRTSS